MAFTRNQTLCVSGTHFPVGAGGLPYETDEDARGLA